MKQSEITSTLANRLNRSGPKVDELLQLTTEVMGNHLSDPGSILLPGLGELVSRKISEYISYDPATDERYLMPPSVRLQFKVVPGLKGRIEVDHLVSLVHKQHPDRSLDDIARLLEEWISLQRELLLEQKTAETKTFGVFSCQLVGNEENIHSGKGKQERFLKYRIEFNPSEMLQNLVNDNFIHFEPSLLNEGVTFDELRIVRVGEKVMDDEYDNVIVIEESDNRDNFQQDDAVYPQNEDVFEQKIEAFEQDSLTFEQNDAGFKQKDISQQLDDMTLPQIESDLKPERRFPILIPILGGVVIAIVAFLFGSRKEM